MSRIIGATVGTTMNPSRLAAPTDEQIKNAVDNYLADNPPGGASEYNELTNKPFIYMKDVDLDSLNEVGVVYIVDGYTLKLGSGERTTYDQRAVVSVTPQGSSTISYYQTIWTPTEYITRRYSGTAWNLESAVRYAAANEKVVGVGSHTTSSGVVEYTLTANTKAYLEISKDCAFILPTVNKTEFSGNTPNAAYADTSILLYAHIPQAVSIDWGADVLFYDGQVPVIEPGYYDIIFTHDPNAEKWCVGVLYKGAAE